MHPPSWVCRQLYTLHPHLRLAWRGRNARTQFEATELNLGVFSIVQLYHLKDSGSFDDQRTIREFWEVESRLDIHGEPVVQRANRGPVFNRYGGTNYDWDYLQRRAVWVLDVDKEYQMQTADVFDGNLIGKLRRWLMPQHERVRKEKQWRQKKGMDLQKHIDDIGNAMAEDLMSSHKFDQDKGVVMAKRHIKQSDLGRLKAYREGRLSFENWYNQ